MSPLYKKSYITILLVAANVLLFLAETFSGGSESTEVAVRFGAMFTPYVMEEGEYFRIFTSMFLHFGLPHLCSNMVALFAIGPYIEKIYGRVNFLLIYLFAGLTGNVLTIAVELCRNQFSLSAGASGAIFGLFGAIAFLSLIPRFRKLFPVKNVLLGLFVNLAYGFSDPQVNIIAHIGGLIGGFVIAAVSYSIRRLLSKLNRTK